MGLLDKIKGAFGGGTPKPQMADLDKQREEAARRAGEARMAEADAAEVRQAARELGRKEMGAGRMAPGLSLSAAERKAAMGATTRRPGEHLRREATMSGEAASKRRDTSRKAGVVKLSEAAAKQAENDSERLQATGTHGRR